LGVLAKLSLGHQLDAGHGKYREEYHVENNSCEFALPLVSVLHASQTVSS